MGGRPVLTLNVVGFPRGSDVTPMSMPAEILCGGDRLVLTKPIGTGIVTTAMKGGTAGEEAARAAVESMASLNRAAAAIGELIAGAEGRIEVVP